MSATVAVVLLAAVVAGAYAPPPGLERARDRVFDEFAFALYWLVLGVLSSIGLGSGLHTFVLFLGPHVVRIATAAVATRSTAFSAAIVTYFTMPQTWDVAGLSQAFSPGYAPDAWDVPTNEPEPRSPVSFIAVGARVAYPAFLWGLGTALGELPPYFVARAAAKAGESLTELEDVELLGETTAAAAVLDETAADAQGPSLQATDSDVSGGSPGRYPRRQRRGSQLPAEAGAETPAALAGAVAAVSTSAVRRRHGASLSDATPPKSAALAAAAAPSTVSRGVVQRHSSAPNAVGGTQGSVQPVRGTRPKPKVTLLARAKLAVYRSVQRYGFWAILIGASIPNPVSWTPPRCDVPW